MVRRSLIAAALLGVAAPLAAQTSGDVVEWQWSSERPDAHGPQGVFGARTLGMGELEIGYHFEQSNLRGVWFVTDSLPLATTLQLYNDAPVQKTDMRHRVRAALGVTEEITLIGQAEFAVMERETAANAGLIRTGTQDLGDIEVGALYSAYASGPYRLQLQAGAIIPIGSSTAMADTTRAQTGAMVSLPYDMRAGAGSFGAILGIGASVQNEVGSLGGQFRLRNNFANNSSGYRLGNTYEANGWAAYNINQAFSVLAGVRWQNWSNIEGADTSLNPNGDPHNLGAFLAGQRAMMPVGVNFRLPDDSRFAGHILSLEGVYSLHHDYEGPQLGLDWALNFGWTLGL